MAGALLGVDVGGTFTDAVLVSDGCVEATKVPTTVRDQSLGVMVAIEMLLTTASITGSDVGRFAHGTTVATNALLERRCAPTAACFTDGFEDVLHIARQDRPFLYRPYESRPEPLVERSRCIGVSERVGVTGTIRSLAEQDIDRVVDDVAAAGVDAVAICLLHSYLDPEHERALAAAIRQRLQNLHVVASHELSRELREYERATTTVVDAALTPVLGPYLERLGAVARSIGLPSALVMQSNAGLDDLDAVASHAARAVLSGPAGGLVAGQRVLDTLDEQTSGVLCLDMGGTSCDVAVVTRARGIERGSGRMVAGLPLQLETVDMHTIGSGGSSIVWRDDGGALRVGPLSAGSEPGPACHGRGGAAMTITDAHVVTGALDPRSFERWGIEPKPALSRRAAERLAPDDPVGVSIGAIAIATTQMAEAARVVSVARGHHPEDLALLAYGGAGGLHACDVADAIGCRTVVVPTSAGVLSAIGLAVADQRRERSVSVVVAHDDATLEPEDTDMLEGIVAEIAGVGASTLVAAQRFAGQTHTIEIAVDVESASNLAVRDALTTAASRFVEEHRRRNGFVLDTLVETVTVRAVRSDSGVDGMPHLADETPWRELCRRVSVGGRPMLAIDRVYGTCLVPDGWTIAEAQERGSMVMTREPAGGGHA